MKDIAVIDAMEKGVPDPLLGQAQPAPDLKFQPKTDSGLSSNSRTIFLRRTVSQSSSTVKSLWAQLLAVLWNPSRSNLTGNRELVVRPVHGGPNGYPKLARFLDSDDNFMLYRRFGFLQTRLLLEKQSSLQLFEQELDELDTSETQGDGNEDILCNRDPHPDETHASRRNELMTSIEITYRDYVSLLQAAQAMVLLNKPSSSEFASVENFMNNEKPLIQEEGSFVYRKEDLVTLRPGREHAWLDSTVERLLRIFNCTFIQWIFRSHETRRKSGRPDSAEVFFTRDRIETFVVLIITFMILTLLIVPIYLLYQFTRKAQSTHITAMCIGILLIFTLFFSLCISLFTRAKRHEILAAAAAYCAVLVVFLGNVGSYANGGSKSSG